MPVDAEAMNSSNSAIVLQVLGWAGMAMIAWAFTMKRAYRQETLSWMNIAGSVLLGASLAGKSAWDGVTLQLLWIAVSISDLTRSRRAK